MTSRDTAAGADSHHDHGHNHHDSLDGAMNPDGPWYMVPRPGRTGNFLVHGTGAFCVGGLGCLLLLAALQKARKTNKSGKSFAELHIPEQDPQFLRRFGLLLLCGTPFGIFFELLDAGPGFDSIAMTHCVLFGTYFTIGFCALCESIGKLPLDTHRIALVLTCWLQALIWIAHGYMKNEPVDRDLHVVLGYIDIANALVVMYSIRFTDSVIAFLSGWALMVLQGAWLFQTGLYECCVDLDMHSVMALLAIYTLAIFLAILIVFMFFGPKLSDQDAAKFRGSYNALSLQEVDDEDDDHEVMERDGLSNNLMMIKGSNTSSV